MLGSVGASPSSARVYSTEIAHLPCAPAAECARPSPRRYPVSLRAGATTRPPQSEPVPHPNYAPHSLHTAPACATPGLALERTERSRVRCPSVFRRDAPLECGRAQVRGHGTRAAAIPTPPRTRKPASRIVSQRANDGPPWENAVAVAVAGARRSSRHTTIRVRVGRATDQVPKPPLLQLKTPHPPATGFVPRRYRGTAPPWCATAIRTCGSNPDCGDGRRNAFAGGGLGWD
jgi:hypothetical protein